MRASPTAQRLYCRYSYCHVATSVGGPSDWLAASPFATTGSGTESVDPGDMKLLNQSDLFFCGPFKL